MYANDKLLNQNISEKTRINISIISNISKIQETLFLDSNLNLLSFNLEQKYA